MKILALEFSSAHRSVAVVELETATEPCSLAKLRDMRNPIKIAEVIQTGHANTMQPFGMIQDALYQAGLERSQIECVAVGLGPGSYTGIRAAIAIAQGWQLAAGIRLVGVSSIAAVVAGAWYSGLRGACTVIVDAQRSEFYLASYDLDNSGVSEIELLRLASLDEVRSLAATGRVLIGPEARRWFAAARSVYPSAAWIARLAAAQNEFISGEKLEPIYLRETRFVKAPPHRLHTE